MGFENEEALLGRGEGVEGAGIGGGSGGVGRMRGRGAVQRTHIRCSFSQDAGGLGSCQVSNKEEGTRACNKGRNIAGGQKYWGACGNASGSIGAGGDSHGSGGVGGGDG